MNVLWRVFRRLFRKKLRKVGFFLELHYARPDAGSIKDYIGTLPQDNLDKVVFYLNAGAVGTLAFGLCRDVLSDDHKIICSPKNGRKIFVAE